LLTTKTDLMKHSALDVRATALGWVRPVDVSHI